MPTTSHRKRGATAAARRGSSWPGRTPRPGRCASASPTSNATARFRPSPGSSAGSPCSRGPASNCTIASEPRRLTRNDAPLAFDGAAPTGCRLIDGPTRDLNLMLRGVGGQPRGGIRRYRLAALAQPVRTLQRGRRWLRHRRPDRRPSGLHAALVRARAGAPALRCAPAAGCRHRLVARRPGRRRHERHASGDMRVWRRCARWRCQLPLGHGRRRCLAGRGRGAALGRRRCRSRPRPRADSRSTPNTISAAPW